jgi:hypothetical protein
MPKRSASVVADGAASAVWANDDLRALILKVRRDELDLASLPRTVCTSAMACGRAWRECKALFFPLVACELALQRTALHRDGGGAYKESHFALSRAARDLASLAVHASPVWDALCDTSPDMFDAGPARGTAPPTALRMTVPASVDRETMLHVLRNALENAFLLALPQVVVTVEVDGKRVRAVVTDVDCAHRPPS